MDKKYTMEIDASYPFGSISVGGEEGSAAGSQKSGQEPQQPQEGPQSEQESASQEGEQGQSEEEQQVPLSVVQSIRQELQEAKQREAQWQAMYAQIQQQQQPVQPQQPQGQQQGPESLLSDYDDDDVITVADMKKVLQQSQLQQPQQPQQFQQPQPVQQPQPGLGQPDPRELQMRSMYPDYDQAIQQIPNILQQAPQLESAIRNSDNPYQTAYLLAKQIGGQGQAQQSQGAQNAQQIQQNLQKPGTAGQVSGGGGISKADYYANMSKEEFEKRRAQILRGI